MSDQASPTNLPTPISVGFSKLDRWTKGNCSARDRITSGIVIPEWSPSFAIPPDAKIFAIGSCFARNIEIALLQQGGQVTSTNPQSEVMEIRANLQTGALNKYNPASIHQELEWAAGLNPFPEEGFLELKGKWMDPYLREQVRQGDLELMRSRREALRQYFARAFSADVVIVTLGLTETWFDRTTKKALTEVPNPRLLQHYPDRFGFRIFAYPDCVALLKSLVGLLKTYGKPAAKIVVTVSPVALERTFSGQDIIVANMTSKSTLRAAAGDLATHVEGVDYFPSYEVAMLSDPLLVWRDDRRNVSDFIVAEIVTEFARRYGLKPPLTPEERQDQMQHLLKTRIAMVQRHLGLLDNKLNQPYQR